jgi:hypothetical protein
VKRKMLSMKSRTSWFFTSRKRRQGDTEARSRRLVHLAEDEGGLVEDTGLFHLGDEVVALTGALADTGEHRNSTVVLRDALDHLLDEHGLADACTAEESDLSAEHVRREKVDDLDAGLEQLGLRLELVECRGLAVDRPALGDLDRLATLVVEDVADDVEHLALGDVAHGNRDRLTRVAHLLAADESVGRVQRDGADQVVSEVLCDLEGDLGGHVTDGERGLEGVVDAGDRVVGELDVDDGAGYAGDAADAGGRGHIRRGGGG